MLRHYQRGCWIIFFKVHFFLCMRTGNKTSNNKDQSNCSSHKNLFKYQTSSRSNQTRTVCPINEIIITHSYQDLLDRQSMNLVYVVLVPSCFHDVCALPGKVFLYYYPQVLSLCVEYIRCV